MPQVKATCAHLCPESRPTCPLTSLLLFSLLPSLSRYCRCSQGLAPHAPCLLTHGSRSCAPLSPGDRTELLTLPCPRSQAPLPSPASACRVRLLRASGPECRSHRSCIQTMWELSAGPSALGAFHFGSSHHSPGESCCSQAKTMSPSP